MKTNLNANIKIDDNKLKLIEKISDKFDKFFDKNNDDQINLDIKLINTQGGKQFKAKYTFTYRSVQIIGRSDEFPDYTDAVRDAQEDAERQIRKVKTKHESRRSKVLSGDEYINNNKEKEYGPKITVKKINIPEGITVLAAIDLMESEGMDTLTYVNKKNKVCILKKNSAPNSYEILMGEN